MWKMGGDGDGADADEYSGDKILGEEGRDPDPASQR